MSVRKRTWTTAKGGDREAWLCDYADQHGKRHAKTFARKKDADAFIAKAKVEVAEGVHTPDSASVTVAEAAELWLAACRGRGLERATIAAYEQHARIHIAPVLGRTKLSRLTAPAVREFEDRLRTADKSQAMVRKILTSLGSLLSDAQELGLVARNVVRDLRARRKKGVDRRADRRQKGRLKVGVDIPQPGRDQGHCSEPARALAADLIDGDLYRPSRF
jgi:integrase